jgi:hypothetical protein
VALLTTQQITKDGLQQALVAAAGGGDTFVAEPGTFLRVKNADGSSKTVTVVTPALSAGGNPIADPAIVVGATTGDVLIGPFGDEYKGANSIVSVTYSAVTSVTVGVFRL